MTIREIERAAAGLRDVIHSIPVSSSKTFSDMSGAELYMKCENLQKTGSFKVRGAYNKIARLAGEGVREVVASSAGNHAQGVAFASTSLGVQSTIVMPRSAPLAKAAATEGYGARVLLYGDCYDEAYSKALEIQQETGAVFVHPFNDEDVVAGQGTIALEILRDIPTVDTVIIPAGGGGLLAGMAFCIKQINPRIQVVGVQAQGADAIVRSFREKKLVATKTSTTIADGIAVRVPGDLTVGLIAQYVDEMVTVNDDEIAEAILPLRSTASLIFPAGVLFACSSAETSTWVLFKRLWNAALSHAGGSYSLQRFFPISPVRLAILLRCSPRQAPTSPCCRTTVCTRICILTRRLCALPVRWEAVNTAKKLCGRWRKTVIVSF